MNLGSQALLHIGLSIICLLALAKAIASFGRGLNIPATATKILRGILIGPTVLGTCFPALSE